MTVKTIITTIFGEKLMPIRPSAVRRVEKNVTLPVPNFLISVPAMKLTPPVQMPVMML